MSHQTVGFSSHFGLKSGINFVIAQAGRHRVEVSAPFFFYFYFLFFVSHLMCKINLSPHYLWCLNSRVVSTSDSESVGPDSILPFLLEVN